MAAGEIPITFDEIARRAGVGSETLCLHLRDPRGHFAAAYRALVQALGAFDALTAREQPAHRMSAELAPSRKAERPVSARPGHSSTRSAPEIAFRLCFREGCLSAGIASDQSGASVTVMLVPVDGSDQFTAQVDVLVDHIAEPAIAPAAAL